VHTVDSYTPKENGRNNGFFDRVTFGALMVKLICNMSCEGHGRTGVRDGVIPL
jgi:hypothetical protein